MLIHKALAPLLALGLLFGCSSSSSKSSTPAPGTVTVYLGADNIPDFDSVVVSVSTLEWSADGATWNTLGSVLKSYDLIKLQNGNGAGVSGLMLSGVTMAPTTITQWRITWDTVSNPTNPSSAASYVTTSGTNATSGNLTMPTHTVLAGKVVVASGVASSVELFIAGAGSVQNTGKPTASNLPVFSFLNATGAAVDLATTCTLTGSLTSTVTATAAPIANVEVYAEMMSAGLPAVVRRSLTDANGNYVLDGLPIATSAGNPITYMVVSQPYNAVTSINYPPQASGPFSASSAGVYSASAFPSFAMAFPATQTSLGTISTTISPASLYQNATQNVSQSTWVEVSQPLAAPAGQASYVPTLIIRSTNAATTAATATALAFDSVVTGSLPTAIPYTVTAQRATSLTPGTLLGAPVPQVYDQPLLTSAEIAPILFTYTATGTVPAS